MTDRINTRILLYVLLVAALVWETFNFGWIAHVFIHPELHPHPLEDHQFVVGSTTMLMVVLLIFSLVMYKRKLAGATNSNEKTFSDLMYENACFKAISSNSNDLINLNDLAGNILYSNEASEKMIGYKPMELVGRSAHEIIHPDDRESIAEDMRKLATGKTLSSSREIRLLRKDGTSATTLARGFSINIGGDLYLGAVLKDISQEKESKSLADINRDFEQSIDAIPDFISIHDNDFRIIKINKALAEYLGETPDEIHGRYCYEIFHNSSKPPENCPHKHVLSHEEASVEEIIDTEPGAALRITCTPLHGRDGNLKGTIHHAKPLLDDENGDQPDEDGIRIFEELILDLKSKDFIMMMCAGCSKYRDENDEWKKIAAFFLEKTSIKLSHGICPDCTKRLYPDFIDDSES
ncbi:MAG: PAS domain S-box protein [Proteobacteria bacterium]|nr:PAS domain S-box protein [Pseudomonadota bacterium]